MWRSRTTMEHLDYPDDPKFVARQKTDAAYLIMATVVIGSVIVGIGILALKVYLEWQT